MALLYVSRLFFFRCEKLPKRCRHKALPYLVVEKHVVHLVACEHPYLHVLAFVEMLPGDMLHTTCNVAMCQVGMSAGIGRHVHPVFPLASAETCLLKEFTLGTLYRVCLLYTSDAADE